jgi:hypothetical protein
LRLPVRAAALALEALGRRDLLDVRVGSEDVLYRYNPATDKLAAIVKEFAASVSARGGRRRRGSSRR